MTASSTTLPAPASLPRAAATTGRIVAVASGKGGVGKTWFAITLAHALARALAHAPAHGGRRVLLFDGDLGLANVDIQLGLLPAHDIGNVVAGQRSLREVIVHHPAGFDILAGRSGSGALASLDDATLETVLAALRAAAQDYDHIILDLGAGIDRYVRRMAQFADLLLVLATEEPTSLTDAYAVLKLHTADRGAGPGEARVVVNQAAGRPSGERTYATLARACTSFLGHTPQLAGIIRRDDRVRDAIRRQTLLLLRHPNSLAAADIEQMVATLLR